MFKIVSWNVNSLRVRLPQLLEWLHQFRPDVVALQETKVTDDQFPQHEIEQAGYQVVFSGQKTFNGVAVLSKTKIADVMTDIPNLDDDQRRFIGCTIQDVRILNVYVPNGQSVGSDKYAYKLEWLKHLTALAREELKQYPNLLITGDFNIAPEDKDVYDPKAWEGHVLVSPKERKAFKDLLSIGLHDGFRQLHPEDDGYSWWDYRMGAFRRNLGMRLDLALMSDSLVEDCELCAIDKEVRKAERPSDHAPLILGFSDRK